jgi:hypothetical protein
LVKIAAAVVCRGQQLDVIAPDFNPVSIGHQSGGAQIVNRAKHFSDFARRREAASGGHDRSPVAILSAISSYFYLRSDSESSNNSASSRASSP